MHRIFFKTLLALASFAVAVISTAAQTVVYNMEESAVAVPESDSIVTIISRLQSPSSGVSVVMPEKLRERALPPATVVATEADNSEETATEEVETEKPKATRSSKSVGYRVQVYADNNVRNAKTQARVRERAIGNAFPTMNTYVSYASPYWRLRVGDFTNQYEAEKAATEIRKAFPAYAKEVRVVRDRINK